MHKIVLKKSFNPASRPFHPWIYRSQIAASTNGEGTGDLLRIESASGRFLGVGYYNPKSEIAVRVLSRRDTPIDKDFFKDKIEKALGRRKSWVRDTNAFRVVSSEADDLPGLVVDRYGDVLVVQFLTLGMEHLRETVLSALEQALPSKGIFERSDSSSRRLEGLEAKVGWIKQECADTVEIFERDVTVEIRFGEGHKTGFYLDQRENRYALRDLGRQGEALDAFCYEGAFGLHLARAGWKVLGLDIQKDAIERAEAHRKRNSISEESLSFKTANVFDELRALEKGGRKFDLVVLDPPSFVKKKQALEGALAGMKEIILRSLKILNEEGLLAVFSCSYHMDDGLLMQTSLSAAVDARKNLRVLKFLKQSADHPINPFIPETYYLKGFLFHA